MTLTSSRAQQRAAAPPPSRRRSWRSCSPRASRSRCRRRSCCRRCRCSASSTARAPRRRPGWSPPTCCRRRSSTPIIGKLGDVHGKGRVLTVVLALFALGGLVNALAGSIELVIAGRVLQGVAARRVPAVVRDHPRHVPARARPRGDQPDQLGVRRRRRHRAAAVRRHRRPHAPVGRLLDQPRGRAGGARRPPRRPAHRATVHGMRIDWTGALLLSGALALLLLGVTQAPSLGWGSPGQRRPARRRRSRCSSPGCGSSSASPSRSSSWRCCVSAPSSPPT